MLVEQRSTDQTVDMEPLVSDASFAYLIRAAEPGQQLLDWAEPRKEALRDMLLEHGALLFRGFEVADLNAFERFIETVSGATIPYHDRATPRNKVQSGVYTSTEYPPHHRIFAHNESSFAATFPGKIFFHCITAPEAGGETPLTDVSRVFERLEAPVRRRFAEKGVAYVRNFGDGFGLPWQEVFGEPDPAAMEAQCRAEGIAVRWKDAERLQTRQVRPAMLRHPETGALVWFNHATVLHVSTLDPVVQEMMLETFAQDDLPNNTYYGDGTPIEPEVLDALRKAYEAETVRFTWQEGDVLMVDNLRVAHGREPFKGSRKVVVGMSEPLRWEEVEVPGVEEVAGGSGESTGLAEEIGAIWCEVLSLDEVDLDDDFYQLGGQSLDAMRIIARVREVYAVRVGVRVLFEAGTLGAFVEEVEREVG